MTKFDLESCSAYGFKYDANNDLQYFEVIVRYDIYKYEQVPGNSTSYAWVFFCVFEANVNTLFQ